VRPVHAGRRAALLLLLALTACGGAASPSPHRSPTPPEPAAYRALWVDAFHPGIHSQQEIDDLVSSAHRANLNALFVQVRKAADAYYLRSLEPVAGDIAGPPGFDPLAYLLQRAHAQQPRIEVHAWVNTFFVGTRSLVYRFQGADWGSHTGAGDTGGFLDPGDPGVRAYTRAVLLNLAARYDVDGLHLDFVRYPEGGDWGYSPMAVAAFDAALGHAGAPDPHDPAWKQWRRNQVTAFVRDLSHALARLRPALRLSAATIAWGAGPAGDAGWRGTAAYDEVYQDWDDWLREGILDLAVPMNYDEAWKPSTARWFEQWTEWEKDQHDCQVLIGVAAFLNYPEDTLNQVRRALLPSPAGHRAAGVAIYSYASTSPYGTTDYTDDASAAATLPRQPYAADLDGGGLRERAQRFNAGFWRLLTERAAYTDPVLGPIRTEPVFPRPAPVPALPPRQQATR
jgi:uncharacterized lipoprotein YddW (UPF0748 family)